MLRARNRARGSSGGVPFTPWFTEGKADGVDPTFWADFINNRYAANGASRSFSDILTLTRASSKWVFNSSGVLTEVTSDQPAYDYDPATGAASGLLVEGQRTNITTYSVPSTVNWGGFDATNTYNSTDTTTPDGTTTSAKVTIGTGTASHNIQGASTSFTSGTTYTLSCYLKAGTTSRAQLTGFSTAFGVGQYANFLLTGDGSVTAVSGGTATIQKCGNGWYRASFTVAATVTIAVGSMVIPFIQTGTDGRNPNFTGNGTDTFYVWGAQCEAGSFPSSYIATAGSSVTRSADVITNSASNTIPFANWYNQSEGTVAVMFDTITTTSGLFPRLISIDNNTTTEMISIQQRNSGVGIKYEVTDGGSNQVSINITDTLDSSRALAATFKVNDFALSIDGASPSTDTSGTTPTTTRMTVGYGAGGTNMFGHIKEIRYYPTRISNSELQRITS